MTESGDIQAVDLELLELVDADWDVNTMSGSLVRPNCIRINGTDVLVPARSSIEFSVDNDSVGVVRMSLFVRSLRYGHVRRDDRTELLGGKDAALQELFRDGTVINGPGEEPQG